MRYSDEELIEDTRYLAETLEDAHPDPYRGHDGRVRFHQRVEELIREIPTEGESLEWFYPRVAKIAALVRDGHTGVYSPSDSDEAVDGRLPLGFKVVGEELYVSEVYHEELESLLGGRLASVEGVPLSDLLARVAHLKGGDNVYQDRVSLANALVAVTPLQHLLDTSVHDLTISLNQSDGSTITTDVSPLIPSESASWSEPPMTLSSSIRLPATNGEPAYRFLDEAQTTALLVLPDMVSYREAHERIRSLGYERGEEMARETYRSLCDDPIPDEYGDVVAALPAALDILTELAERMAESGTDHLLIDTRENNGGNSLLSNELTYILHGWEGIEKASENDVEIAKDSELYRERIGDDGPIGETTNPTGFDFGSYFDRDDSEERVARQREWLAGSSTFAAEMDSGEYEAFYCPNSISVITSAQTYSAGAEPAFTLSELGATVVGVPPAQAPNVPRDMLKGELPHTGLEFKVAYRHVESRPDIEGRVFPLDIELTPERFETMGCLGNAALQLALDR